MPFRDPTTPAPVPFDPLARFFELEAAFEVGRGLLGDHVPLRLASAHLVLSSGEPALIVERVRAAASEVESGRRGVFSELRKPLCLVIAAVLVQRGDDPRAFVAELERVRPIMRGLKIRHAPSYEAIAILALRIRNQLAPITEEQVVRLRDIYEAMKGHRYMLTGPEELPACAFFVGQRASSPAEIGLRGHAVYEGLLERGKLWRGDPLQLAANMLALSSLEPSELVDRFVTLVHEFERREMMIRANQYDELALLCFLARPIEKIVDAVLEYTAAIRERLAWADRPAALTLAANLAFVRLVGDDPELGVVADAKALLDMQTIIAARQAGGSA